MELPYEDVPEEYLINIPRYIQDIVWLHHFRYHLSEEEKPLFDWLVDYLKHDGRDTGPD